MNEQIEPNWCYEEETEREKEKIDYEGYMADYLHEQMILEKDER